VLDLLNLDTSAPRFNHRCAVFAPPVPVDDSDPLFGQAERELMHLFHSERTGPVTTDVDTGTP